ncbi:Uncharacterised protein [Mycobacteroides abscessus subsp. abscessus]|nr:Uncharacterised protein [Mycobacteroides abscessus subsp. abscessus]
MLRNGRLFIGFGHVLSRFWPFLTWGFALTEEQDLRIDLREGLLARDWKNGRMPRHAMAPPHYRPIVVRG